MSKEGQISEFQMTKEGQITEFQMTNGRQNGFTLVELLIVIFIMSILTVMAVGAYAGVQRQARIDFAADTLIASLREEQLLAESGRTVAAADPSAAGKLQCFALRITTGPKGGLWSAPTNYIGLEAADPSVPASGGKIDTCDPIPINDENLWQKRDIFDGDIMVKSIKAVSGVSSCSSETDCQQVFYFKPPFGQLYLQNSSVLEAQRDGVFDYIVGVADQPGFDRKVEYDVSTGEAKKIK